MTAGGSLLDFTAYFQSAAPEYLDLATADSDEDIASAFDVILEKCLDMMACNSKLFHNLCEDALTSILLMGLSRPGITATREAHSNGHVDLSIHIDCRSPVRKILIEAKIHKGPQYHIDGMAQLLNRYLTGSEICGVLVSYIKIENIKGLTKDIIARLDGERPLKQLGNCYPHPKGFKWMFVSKHTHSSGEEIEIHHAGCNLFCADL